MNDSIVGNPNCTECPLHETAQWVCLMGRGAIPAKIMIIGEAPGAREDSVGKPFQGQAGQLLDKLLGEAGIKRDRCYISNAVKCRPPENRTPKPKEMKACKHYLEDEIAQVRPKFVLLLGAVALKTTLGKAKITEIHGEPRLVNGITYFPTFHPAAALRDPKRMPDLVADMKIFGDLVKGFKRENKHAKFTKIETGDQFEAMLAKIIRSWRIAFDVETNSLNPYSETSQINSLQITADGETFVLPLCAPDSPWREFEDQESMVIAINIAIRSPLRGRKRKRRVVAQNGKFDNNFLHEMYGVRFPMTDDIMLMSHLNDENASHGLKSLARQYCGAPNYDIDEATKLCQGDMPTFYQYAADDPHWTSELLPILQKKLEDQELWPLYRRMVMPVARAFEKIESNGNFLDKTKMDTARKELEGTLEKATREMQAFAGSRRQINWRSTKQINELLFNKLGLEPRGKTPGGAPSTNETFLKMMRDDHPIIPILLKYREADKLNGTYIGGWDKRRSDDWIHPKFKISGTITGRPSCEDPNLQAVPRNKKIRSVIGAPEGWDFFELDYSQVELRVAAMIANEQTMLRLFREGEDIHYATAARASGKRVEDITKEERKAAKAINFGFLYGMGWKKFMDYARDKYEVKVTEAEAKKFRQKFFSLFSDLEAWHDKQRRIVRTLGQVRTLTGRIRHLPEINSPDRGLAAQAERDAINSPVQGFAAELTLMAIAEADAQGLVDGEHIKVSGTIHDAIVGRVRKGKASQYLRQLHDIMVHPPLLDYFGIEMNVPIVVDAKLGNWGIGRQITSWKPFTLGAAE